MHPSKMQLLPANKYCYFAYNTIKK